MIQGFFDRTRPCADLSYLVYTKQAEEAQEALVRLLDKEGLDWLEQLEAAHLRQSNVEIKDAFAEGFCMAVELALEILARRECRISTDPPD